MGSQANMEKMQQRQNYRNVWHTDLMRTIQNNPPCMCCFCIDFYTSTTSSISSFMHNVLCVGLFCCVFNLAADFDFDFVFFWQIVACPFGGKCVDSSFMIFTCVFFFFSDC